MDELQSELKEIKELQSLVINATKKSVYAEQLSEILVEELIRERVLSRDKTEIIKKRATIRSKEKLKE